MAIDIQNPTAEQREYAAHVAARVIYARVAADRNQRLEVMALFDPLGAAMYEKSPCWQQLPEEGKQEFLSLGDQAVTLVAEEEPHEHAR